MELKEAINLVKSKFIYKPDVKYKLFDSWSVMKEKDGKYQGDCEDFALTVFWHMSDKNLRKFLLNLMILHKYRIYQCDAFNGPHMIGRFGDLWFDNWTYSDLPEKEFFSTTGHKNPKMMFMPICIIQLIKGYAKRTFKKD